MYIHPYKQHCHFDNELFWDTRIKLSEVNMLRSIVGFYVGDHERSRCNDNKKEIIVMLLS